MTSLAATQVVPIVAAANAASDALIVSIHDVAPSKRALVERILPDLAAAGVRVCSLLVVPDYHHEGLFTQDRQFVSWLRQLESEGHEIVIHGYFHQRPTRLKETWRDKFMTRFYTQREGEFYDLDYNEALRRITAARDQFREAGLTVRGFIAPAWLLSAGGERAARDGGMEYTTRLRTVVDLRSAQTFVSQSLVYSVHTDWRRTASQFWNAALAQFLRTNPLLRLGIHPPDRLYPRIWRQIIDSLMTMRTCRTPTTYRDWVGEQRLRATT